MYILVRKHHAFCLPIAFEHASNICIQKSLVSVIKSSSTARSIHRVTKDDLPTAGGQRSGRGNHRQGRGGTCASRQAVMTTSPCFSVGILFNSLYMLLEPKLLAQSMKFTAHFSPGFKYNAKMQSLTHYCDVGTYTPYTICHPGFHHRHHCSLLHLR
jgi:hypothetical protein